MNRYCIFRLEKVKSFTKIREIENHNKFRDRLKHRKHPELSPHNKNLCSGFYNSGDSYVERFHHRVGDQKIRSNAVLAFDIFLGYSPEMRNLLNHEQWVNANIKWIAEQFGGVDNIASIGYHIDETTPHLHCLVFPVNAKGKLNAYSFVQGKESLSCLQDSYAKAMEPLGLERGNRYLDDPEKYTRPHSELKPWRAAQREAEKSLDLGKEDLER
jgi:hypothetical protein